MKQNTRHQCHIYDGPPSRGLAKMAAAITRRLGEGYRCLYLNDVAMVAEMSGYLGGTGTNVERETTKGNLLLSSERNHLSNGGFEIDRMIDSLEDAVTRAWGDGYKGLWAAGDMTWELGREGNFAQVLTYESQLDDLFSRQPALSGVCQYHMDTLTREAVHSGLVSHSSIFVNEAERRSNPYYFRAESLGAVAAADRVEWNGFIAELCSADTEPSR